MLWCEERELKVRSSSGKGIAAGAMRLARDYADFAEEEDYDG